jgi:succinate dehydrogenase / fumarate reductase, iron-sulfur subunit
VNFVLEIWRQDADGAGAFERFHMPNVDADASFLEMLDQLNERLIAAGERSIAFDSDCREGICGACSLVIDGMPHGPEQVTSCQTFMRSFTEGATIRVEPFRNNAFPVLRDLVVDRGALDRVIQAGGYVSVSTGPQPHPNAMPVSPDTQRRAMDAAACIGCGACVAACPNGAAMLFTGAKVSHLNRMPQGQAERADRVLAMVDAMDDEGFGGCTNFGECSRVCPQEISLDVIGMLNSEYRRALRAPREQVEPRMSAQ